MKKSLLAVAAIGAFASAAQAQSSVTVYGIMDVNVNGSNTRNASGTAVTTKTGGLNLGGSGESTSRLGFKGSEDLGGGTSAFFTVETALDPNGATQFSTTSTRQAFAGLKKNGIGSFAIGTQYTPIHEAVGATDAGMTNNVMGNLIYVNSAVNSGSATNKGGTGSQSALDNNVAYSVRLPNSLTLKTDNFAGFTARGMVVSNSSNANQTSATAGGQSNQTGYAIGVDYAWQKLYLTANYQTFKANGPSSNATTPVLFSFEATPVAGTNVNDSQQYYAATYDFGILKAYAQYVNRKAANAYSADYYSVYSAQQIGVRAPITPTITAWASAGTGGYEAYGQTGLPKNNLRAFQVGSDYALSKRTNLYAIFGQSSVSNAQISNTTTSAFASANSNNYAVGVRHTF
jgi:predicted porin